MCATGAQPTWLGGDGTGDSESTGGEGGGGGLLWLGGPLSLEVADVVVEKGADVGGSESPPGGSADVVGTLEDDVEPASPPAPAPQPAIATAADIATMSGIGLAMAGS
jgi:hypothetical protein